MESVNEFVYVNSFLFVNNVLDPEISKLEQGLPLIAAMMKQGFTEITESCRILPSSLRFFEQTLLTSPLPLILTLHLYVVILMIVIKDFL